MPFSYKIYGEEIRHSLCGTPFLAIWDEKPGPAQQYYRMTVLCATCGIQTTQSFADMADLERAREAAVYQIETLTMIESARGPFSPTQQVAANIERMAKSYATWARDHILMDWRQWIVQHDQATNEDRFRYLDPTKPHRVCTICAAIAPADHPEQALHTKGCPLYFIEYWMVDLRHMIPLMTRYTVTGPYPGQVRGYIPVEPDPPQEEE